MKVFLIRVFGKTPSELDEALEGMKQVSVVSYGDRRRPALLRAESKKKGLCQVMEAVRRRTGAHRVNGKAVS